MAVFLIEKTKSKKHQVAIPYAKFCDILLLDKVLHIHHRKVTIHTCIVR